MSPVENVYGVLLQISATLTHPSYIYPLQYAMVTHGRVLIKEKALWTDEYMSQQIFEIVLILKNLKELILHANLLLLVLICDWWLLMSKFQELQNHVKRQVHLTARTEDVFIEGIHATNIQIAKMLVMNWHHMVLCVVCIVLLMICFIKSNFVCHRSQFIFRYL